MWCSFNKFAVNKAGSNIGPKWSQPEILHLRLTLNQKGTEKWTGWTPWDKWCLSGFMHNNCLWCKWGHPSATTYVQSNLYFYKAPHARTKAHQGTMLLQHAPGTEKQTRDSQDQGPSFQIRFRRLRGSSSRQQSDIYPFLAVLLGSFNVYLLWD